MTYLDMTLGADPQIAIWSDEGRDNSAASVGVSSVSPGKLRISVDALRDSAITFIALRWKIRLPTGIKALGDHWERGYGDLEWRSIVPERVLPWYVLVHNSVDGSSGAFGVETGASSFASWRLDESGVTLVLDVRCGGLGVQLGTRTLLAATVYFSGSEREESPFAFASRFCRLLCQNPRLTDQPIYGCNDWYYRYGNISAETVRRDASLLRDLSPSRENAPTYVIDAGWADHVSDGGPYGKGRAGFPDMPGLANEIKNMGVRPGIWIRPLLMGGGVPEQWQLREPHPHKTLPGIYMDPSLPEVLDWVRADIERLSSWGFGLIKHDFTTFDIFGKWGFEMGPLVTEGMWSFADRTRTSAEIILSLYKTIREAAGASALIGCNTVGHLAAGLFELQRTGDDTSGKHWERTRKMGINTLAFRMPQHNTFFAADADCVGLTSLIPWEQNKQWLDLLARSGTALFVSADPDYVGPAQRAALTAAFELAAVGADPAEPLDWFNTTSPRHWRFGGETRTYDWSTFPETSFACPP